MEADLTRVWKGIRTADCTVEVLFNRCHSSKSANPSTLQTVFPMRRVTKYPLSPVPANRASFSIDASQFLHLPRRIILYAEKKADAWSSESHSETYSSSGRRCLPAATILNCPPRRC